MSNNEYMRIPEFSGQFYPAERVDIAIEHCMKHKLGPRKAKLGPISAAIAPHAGYVFSGPCAAWTYKAIENTPVPDAYLILGLNHNGPESAFSEADWHTPMGLVKNYKELTRALSNATGIQINEHIHKHEHSIEVQLPFLQYANRERQDQLRFVPLMVGAEYDFSNLAERIKSVTDEINIIVIASSDFTHYGSSYGYIPFHKHKRKKMEALDMSVIKKICNTDIGGFRNQIEETGATICGKNPINLLLEIVRKKGKLLSYYTSGDILEDHENMVGYASIVF